MCSLLPRQGGETRLSRIFKKTEQRTCFKASLTPRTVRSCPHPWGWEGTRSKCTWSCTFLFTYVGSPGAAGMPSLSSGFPFLPLFFWQPGKFPSAEQQPACKITVLIISSRFKYYVFLPVCRSSFSPGKCVQMNRIRWSTSRQISI